jgi:Cytochrome c3
MIKPTHFFSVLLLALASTLIAQPDDTLKLKPSYFEVNDFVADNESCLKCHGESKYLIEDPNSGRSITNNMCPDRTLDRDDFYSSVHKSFSCTDCHSYEYMTFPHPLEVRFEEHFMCLDCHGYDESFAQYHFEDIEMEFQKSTHNMEDFSCWKCHDPHSYKAFMRNAEDLKEAILYDNNMCLNCHADFSRFTLLTDREEINVVESHDWLPNQTAHFRSVRCIECHTAISDSILIAHQILPKADAVKRCTECHSSNSRLMHTLYKFQSKEERKGGFINGVIMTDYFVIGANKSPFLDKLSFLILAGTLLGIAFHTFLRIRNKKTD